MIYGRLKIYSNAKEITAENVVDEVNKAYAVHSRNQSEIRTLWEYYRGKTKILNKTKEIREEINHKINENRAYEIVKFHKGYVFGEPKSQNLCKRFPFRIRKQGISRYNKVPTRRLPNQLPFCSF